MSKSSKRNSTPEKRGRDLEKAYNACSFEKPVTLKALAEYLGVKERTVRNYVEESENFYVKYGCVLEK